MNIAESSRSNRGGGHIDRLLSKVEKLKDLLALPAAIAANLRRKIFTLAVLSLLSGAWLGYYFWKKTAPGAGMLTFVAMLVLLPGLVLFAIQYFLGEFSSLPARLDAYANSISAQRENYQQARDAFRERQSVRLSDVFTLMKSVREIYEVAGESRDLMAVLGQSFLVVNPLLAFALIASSIFSALILFGAFLSLIFVFF